MLLLIVLLVVVAIVMALLADGANTMLFHSDRAYATAVQRNLKASGLAWAQHKAYLQEAIEQPVELHLDAMNIRGSATMSVTVSNPTEAGATARIRTTCARGRHKFTAENTYILTF